jgi:hypothetical protein
MDPKKQKFAPGSAWDDSFRKHVDCYHSSWLGCVPTRVLKALRSVVHRVGEAAWDITKLESQIDTEIARREAK